MIKVLFFIPGLSEGGAEKVLCNLVNNMDQSKFDITVQTVYKFEPKKYLADGIKYKSIIKCKTQIGRKIMDYWYRFCTEFKLTYPLYIKDNYDIEVAYLECGATKAMAASTNKRALKLAWVHCDLKRKGVTAEKIGKYYSKYDKVVCVSKDVKKSFDEIYGLYAESVVLYNIIDEDEIFKKASAETVKWGNKPGQKKLLAVGRLTKQKNFEYLIYTCGKLWDSGYQFQLKILGEGPERANLDQQIKRLHLEDQVELKGFTSNPYPWMKAADMIVCSSRYEGISTVVQEALILGKPVVTTPCTGMEELLGESEFGVIAEASDDGLYRGLKEIFDKPEQMEHYAYAARERSKEFVKRRIIKETEKFFMHELEYKREL